MIGGVPYDLIQGQGQGHESFKFKNSLSNFQSLSRLPFTMGAGK